MRKLTFCTIHIAVKLAIASTRYLPCSAPAEHLMPR